jgi:hypothetical protein
MYDTVHKSLTIDGIYHGDTTAQQHLGMDPTEIQVQAPESH